MRDHDHTPSPVAIVKLPPRVLAVVLRISSDHIPEKHVRNLGGGLVIRWSPPGPLRCSMAACPAIDLSFRTSGQLEDLRHHASRVGADCGFLLTKSPSTGNTLIHCTREPHGAGLLPRLGNIPVPPSPLVVSQHYSPAMNMLI